MKKTLTICAALALSGCMIAPFNQSQDELRAAPEKFGGSQDLQIPFETFLNNAYLTTKHCSDFAVFHTAPDRKSASASAAIPGLSRQAYLIIIDAEQTPTGTKLSFWGQNASWKERAGIWIEQVKNPQSCMSKP